MTFKDFMQKEGLFGNVIGSNPGTMFHRVEKRLAAHPTNKKGTSVKRMLAGPKVSTPPMPTSVAIPGQQNTLRPFSDRPKKPKKVKSPLDIL